MTDVTLPRQQDTWRGFGFALTAYLMWGFLPIYMKQLAHISPIEVIAHRVIWSVPIALIVLALTGQLAGFWQIWRNPRMLGMGAVTAALISVNWGLYIWAIGTGHALQAALGYYINPLFSIFLGAVLLGERLGRVQQVAIGLAALAVGVLTWQTGTVPWVALGLTVTWGFYAYFKRALSIGANQGFLLEVLILLVPSLGYVIWLGPQGHFLIGDSRDNGLLLIAGLVTAGPLMIYANGAKLLRLSTIGIMQYIAPTMIFLTATFVFGEPLGTPQILAFGLIWAALILYSTALVRGMRS
ncbi:MAG: EamA family transporter RarD [Candidatus Saccharibacteria bacterium]|nr:EamA family transporter RarD [Pseudorhodobacter sp.]